MTDDSFGLILEVSDDGQISWKLSLEELGLYYLPCRWLLVQFSGQVVSEALECHEVNGCNSFIEMLF